MNERLFQPLKEQGNHRVERENATVCRLRVRAAFIIRFQSVHLAYITVVISCWKVDRSVPFRFYVKRTEGRTNERN